MRYAWCNDGDHDTAKRRGGCPIKVGNNKPCSCFCHQGEEEARHHLPKEQKLIDRGFTKKQSEALRAEFNDDTDDDN